MPSTPVIVVLGATGVGKSQLAVEIARNYNGEVISADSMQLYKGLDVTTNKVTAEEMAGVPHYMIDIVNPTDSFTVVDFRNRALPIVERLRKTGKIPVIVGGTNYYIESILWENLVAPDSAKDIEFVSSVPTSSDPEESSESLHARLKAIDPKRANTIHPRDRRKIERSLDIYAKQKRPHSEFLKDQADAGGVLGGPLKYKNAVIFWIRSEQQALESRLDVRVDKMIERGLINEMLDFHKQFNATRKDHNYELGIFQSIGFKEFHDYLVASEEFRQSKAGQKAFKFSLWLMKQRTKKYSKYQNKWIARRFLGEPTREVPPIYALDGTDLEKWNENVRDVALEILCEFFESGKSSKYQPLEACKVNDAGVTSRVCECGVICMDARSWEAHKTSKKHYQRLQHLNKQNKEDVNESSSKRQRVAQEPEQRDAAQESAKRETAQEAEKRDEAQETEQRDVPQETEQHDVAQETEQQSAAQEIEQRDAAQEAEQADAQESESSRSESQPKRVEAHAQ